MGSFIQSFSRQGRNVFLFCPMVRQLGLGVNIGKYGCWSFCMVGDRDDWFYSSACLIDPTSYHYLPSLGILLWRRAP